MKPTDTAAGIDAILDGGAEGLRYFEVFLPRYRDWTGNAPVSGDYAALAAGYDRERGMDLEPLRVFATALGTELDRHLDHEAQALAGRAGSLPVYWNGSAAAANAHRFLADAATRATTGFDTLRSIHITVSAAVTRLEDAVRGKADIARRDYGPDTAGGRTPPQIDWIIDCARHHAGPATEGSVVAELRAALPESALAGDADAPTLCAKWLDTVLVPEIDTRAAAFADLCDTTNTTIIGIYDEIVAALDRLPVPAFTSPGGQPSADTDLAYTGRQPGYPTASADPAAVTPPSTPAQDMTVVAQTPSAATNITSPVQTFGLALETASTTPAGAQPTTTIDSGPAVRLTPAATSVSDTTDQPAGTTNQSSPAPDDPGSSPASTTTTPPDTPESTSAPGRWTPGDIANMVTAVGTITGSIPDLVNATAILVGNLDEIITAAGNAAATVIDAVDNQSAAPPESQTTDPTGQAPPSEQTGDPGTATQAPEAAPGARNTTAPEERTDAENRAESDDNPQTGDANNIIDPGTAEPDSPAPSGTIPDSEGIQPGQQPTLPPPSPPLDPAAMAQASGLGSAFTASAVVPLPNSTVAKDGKT
ncbi:hypothetical protein [Nocardia brevicatena]|uniref:hypothetical protein n=1 Tax=Nocardia brevicatena TaxID=37327 RepID=UPI0002D6796D|nr:hypothetical protein [Nocardia brevicatena]